MEKAIKKYWPVFVLPTAAAFALGFIYPFLQGVYLSFCRFITIDKTSWIGLENYAYVLNDADFLHSFLFSTGFTIVSTLLAPIMTPLLTYLLAGAWVDVSLVAMIISVVKVILVPVLLGMGLGLLAAKLFKVEYDKATAISIEVGMQNSGLAVSLAAANFAANPLATLPGAIFSVWHNISGSVFASIRRMDAERKVKVSVEQ